LSILVGGGIRSHLLYIVHQQGTSVQLLLLLLLVLLLTPNACDLQYVMQSSRPAYFAQSSSILVK
jgi:hypothetical protein